MEDWEIDLPEFVPPSTMKLMQLWGDQRFLGSLDRPDTFDAILSEMPSRVADVLCADLLLGDVLNGTFHQYFHNSFGITINKAITAMRRLDLSGHANAAEAALAVFGTDFPRDRLRRMERIEELPENAFDAATDQFYAAEDRHSTGMNEKLQDEASRLLSEGGRSK